MDIQNVTIDGERHVELRLRNWIVPPRRIGDVEYQGQCAVVRVRRATYQLQSTTFGASSAVFGLTSRGTGFATGGGGFVETVHRGVVSVIVEDAAGGHTNLELPAELAVLEDRLIRLDLINGHVVAATNMSGRRERIVLLGPSAFVNRMSLTKRHYLLLLFAVMMAPQVFSPHPFLALATTASLVVLPLYRIGQVRERASLRKRLATYMAEVMS